MKILIWIPVLTFFAAVSCSASYEEQPKPEPIQFSAQFTVADSIDVSGDYSGVGLLIFSRERPEASADTIYYGVTDSSGYMEGIIDLDNAGSYPAQISRNGSNIGAFRILLAGNDTVRVTGEFPELDKTLEVDSREARAMGIFQRVDNGFRRTNRFIMAGQIADSMLVPELRKWADLFWDVYKDEEGTFASKFALEQSMSLYNRFDKPEMFRKLNSAFDEDMAYGLAVTIGKDYVAAKDGLNAAVSYLDSVKSLTRIRDINRAIDQSVIKLNFDSARVEQAQALLGEYKDRYLEEGEELPFWYKNMRFEITELAPGMDVPAYSFVTVDGDTVTNENMLGKPYILEFTLMANRLYQSQYEEATVLYQIYHPAGLEYFTLPFDESANTVIGFFEERDRFWGLADPPTFNAEQFSDRFNIQFYPSRILIDREGKIVRKFIGEEFDDMIPSIIETVNSN